MRFFFDIHVNDEIIRDEVGGDFNSPEQARRFLLENAGPYTDRVLGASADIGLESFIEITDRQGFSDVVTMTEIVEEHSNPRRALQSAARKSGIG